MIENIRLKWALWYLEKMNFSVIPIKPGDKKPLIPWQKYQKERASREQVIEWWAKNPNANIGIVTGTISDLNVIDIDSDEGRENIEPYLPDTFIAPTVHTPRGGLHNYCRNVEGMTNKAGAIKGTDFRGEGGYVVAPPSANGNGKQYLWSKELHLKDVTIPQLPKAYVNKISISSIKEYVRSKDNESLQTLQTLQILQRGTRDNDIFHVLNCLSKGGYEKEYAYKIAEIVASQCDPPFNAKDAHEKVESAYGRTERRERSITQEIRDYVSLQDSYIHLTDAYETLQFLHPGEKSSAQVVFHRLCKEGVIEKISRGCFRKIEKDCADIDIFDADTTPLEIDYPLGISDFINTYPKNIVVVAGEPDAGKTAFLLNFAKKNMDKHEIVYFSSEMGKIELKSRLQKFDAPLSIWKKINWKERSTDFAPMIRPDSINIIDFLEVHDEFYKVGLFIKQIFDKLNKGIAVIALQKPRGRDEGLGGQRGLEKPRLYLSMSNGFIRIVKAKNWKHDMLNPNGMGLRWKLAAGCKFKKEGDWER